MKPKLLNPSTSQPLNPMAGLKALIQKIERLNMTDIAKDSLAQTEDEMVDYQRAQMFKGQNSQGGIIGEYKTEEYAEEKYKRGIVPPFKERAPFGIVDLRDTGDFFAGMTASLIGDEIVFDSSDSKTPDLMEKYGEKIFGLNKETKSEFITVVLKPEAFSELKKRLK